MPGLTVVALPDTAVKESREHVRSLRTVIQPTRRSWIPYSTSLASYFLLSMCWLFNCVGPPLCEKNSHL
jgi:hypothetical protein